MDAVAAGTLRREALTEWGQWLTRQWDWSWWVTLQYEPKRAPLAGTMATHGTFELDPRTGEHYWASVAGWSLSDRHFKDWLNAAMLGERMAHVYWFRGREPNKYRYGTHFHALVGGFADTVSRRRAWELWFQVHGNARIEPFDPGRGAEWYIAKYVAKELGDLQFSGNALRFLKEREVEWRTEWSGSHRDG